MGLNAWLRDALRGEPALYEAAFTPTSIDDIRHESPVVIVIVVPVAIKVGGGVAAGVTTVFKSVEKYFTVKQKRAKEKRARAQEKQAQAEEGRAVAEEELARARTEEARANTERARAGSRQNSRADAPGDRGARLPTGYHRRSEQPVSRDVFPWHR